jgi:peroxiredoxin Q/BCP
MIKLHEKAPDFKLMGSDGKEHSLSDYRGKKVILYFYPRDNTPGCTLEAESFRDHNDDLLKENAVILGVSRDSLDSHDKFIEKLGLPFVLLADEDSTVCTLYDVLKEKNMYGKKSIGIARSTFIIDEEGNVIYENRKVKAEGHGEEIRDFLQELKK